MSRRIALSSCVLAILVGCSGADEGVTKSTTGRGGSSTGSGGSETTGSGGSGGSTGGTTGTGGSTGGTGGSSTGGTGGATGGTGGATGGTGGATGGTGGATGGTGGATGGTGGATGGTGGTTGGTAGTGGTGGAAGTGGSAGTGGAKDAGTAGTGGSAGTTSKDGGAGTGGTGGTGTTDAGPAGTSKCGAPLDTAAPTTATLGKDGPLATATYTLPAGTNYKSLTVYYPTAGTGPYVVVTVSPGLTEVVGYLTGWLKRFASNGYVAVFVEANNTGSDSGAMRGDGAWEAIATMKAENTKSGGTLSGKLSDCYVTSGHSLGGGAALLVANNHPTDVKGALGFNPYDPGSFSKVVAPTLILTAQGDTTATPAQHGRHQYDTMPASTIKEYVEESGGVHQSALSPGTVPGPYAVAWIKYNVDGDVRFRPFLDKLASGLNDFATTLP